MTIAYVDPILNKLIGDVEVFFYGSIEVHIPIDGVVDSAMFYFTTSCTCATIVVILCDIVYYQILCVLS